MRLGSNEAPMRVGKRGPAGRLDHNPLRGIALKIASVSIFVAMFACIKAAGVLPAGQIVFFRSFFAFPPVLIMLAWQGELRSILGTKRPLSHILRGIVGVMSMGLGFFALTRLPLPEAITLSYAQPLLVVVFSVLFLGEKLRVYRWSAVMVGLAGVCIVSWPKLTLFTSTGGLGNQEAIGVAAALVAAAAAAVAMLLVRDLVRTERSATIVLWFSLTASVAGVLTLPFGWSPLSGGQAAFLVAAGFCGGVAQILMTEAYRHAEASTVAPFEYTSMVLGVAIGYLAFGEVPTPHMIIGGIIVIYSGLFIIWRERVRGIRRVEAGKVGQPQ